MTLEFILRIFIAGLLGGLVGLERELRAKEAGVRTHFLVALGSGLLMVLSQYAFKGDFDASRVAAQGVSGMGFIGAGTIIFQKNAVRGLTTAAGIWVAAAIGLASGAGMYVLAGAATLMVIVVLEAMNLLLHRDRNVTAIWFADDRAALLDSIDAIRKAPGLSIASYALREENRAAQDGRTVRYSVSAELKVRRDFSSKSLTTLLDALSGVHLESIVG